MSAANQSAVFWVLFDAKADQKYIKKCDVDGSLAFFDAEHEAARAKRSHPGTDYKRVDYYTAPPPPQWISVEERLPARHSLVIVANADGVAIGMFLTTKFHELPGHPKVTHWMPLPPPPQ
jgi:hypothetical protein